MSGIKETQEALIGVFALAAYIIERTRDGLGIDDIAAVYAKLATDKVFVKKLTDAKDGMEKINDELQDLEFNELLALSLTLAPEVLGVLGKLKPETKAKLMEAITKLIPVINEARKIQKSEGGAS